MHIVKQKKKRERGGGNNFDPNQDATLRYY